MKNRRIRGSLTKGACEMGQHTRREYLGPKCTAWILPRCPYWALITLLLGRWQHRQLVFFSVYILLLLQNVIMAFIRDVYANEPCLISPLAAQICTLACIIHWLLLVPCFTSIKGGNWYRWTSSTVFSKGSWINLQTKFATCFRLFVSTSDGSVLSHFYLIL
jgi:hypothetical protein